MVALRLVLGVFWVERSHEKWDWFESGELQRRLQLYSERGEGLQKRYVDGFCLPYHRPLLYLVVFGEMAVGLSFLLGYLTRVAVGGGAFMALNFLFAQGSLLEWGFLANPYGPLLITAMMVAAYGGGEEVLNLRLRRPHKEIFL